jgi:hypothetical protein
MIRSATFTSLVLLASVAVAQLPQSVYLIDSNSVSGGNPQGRRVFRFNSDGSLIGTVDNPYSGNFIGPSSTNLNQTPLICAPRIVNGQEKLLISNQGGTISQFSATGVFESTFISGLDNPRGISLGPDGYYYIAEGNTNRIRRFRQDGTEAGDFASGVTSCWYVLHRRNGDKLISRSTTVSGGATPQVERWSAGGAFLGNFATGYAFTQQMAELDNGNVLVCVFSPNSGAFAKADGLYEFTSTGTEVLRYDTPGARGVVVLTNGNYLSTGGTNVVEHVPGNPIGNVRIGFGGTVGPNASNFRMLYRHRYYTANVNVTLGQFDFGDVTTQPVTVQLRHVPSGNIVDTQTLTLDASGNASFQTLYSGDGMFQLYIKASHWLTKAVPLNLGPATATVTATLTNGDVDGDNLVSILDYLKVSAYYELDSSASNWNTPDSDGVKPSSADLDGDGVVSILDYIIVSTNYELAGDDPTS